MKVICRRLYDQASGKNEFRQEECKTRTIGKEYVVLAIKIHPKTGISYYLINDINAISCYGAKGFEMVSNQLPSNWCADKVKAHGDLYLCFQNLGNMMTSLMK